MDLTFKGLFIDKVNGVSFYVQLWAYNHAMIKTVQWTTDVFYTTLIVLFLTKPLYHNFSFQGFSDLLISFL